MIWLHFECEIKSNLFKTKTRDMLPAPMMENLNIVVYAGVRRKVGVQGK